MERMPIWQVAVRRLEMPIARFLFIFVGGATFVGLLAALALIFFTGGLVMERYSKASLEF